MNDWIMYVAYLSVFRSISIFVNVTKTIRKQDSSTDYRLNILKCARPSIVCIIYYIYPSNLNSIALA